jgi:hypothetical protein
MMRLHPGAALSAAVLAVLACSCSSSPASSHASDAAADAPKCTAPTGADSLSFDVVCTGSCRAQRHVTFDVAPGDRERAPCVAENGHLQLYHLVGDDQSVFELDVVPGYTGAGSYSGLGAMGDLQYTNVAVTCAQFGALQLELNIPDSTDPKGTCSVAVTQDCGPVAAHSVVGTFNCSLPVTDRGASCTIKNGTFSFKHCE